MLEAGRPDYRWDVFSHMPAALTFPIGSWFYDWRYDGEPDLNGRRIYQARARCQAAPARGRAAGVGGPGAEMAESADGGAQWLLARRRPGSTNHFEGGDFVRGNEEVAYPNLVLDFLPIAISYGSAPAGQHGYQVHMGR